ncbi:prepilin-type N-terminal cleavage/methylation domain-containing protein [Halomonas maura]|uniref:prepilin-type N-terminal cleavage/methylation domain-containing protein n=1 Tax=Halomonas maura TaxID=117606 RepID=UPI0025B3238E|nr:prepilin-type N-terminal cleavage/methylation domain-containing protein [Halomonas maura]MDN3557130.1 prepilin-type N-terminal cleavage/methylation domain-containing protein [Halomonas maura]
MKSDRPKSQRGFTLVELMVALVLGLLVVLGVSQIYLSTLQSSRAITDVAARQEVVSYFSHVVGNEVRASLTAYPVSGGGATDSAGNLQINFTGDAADPPFSDLYCPGTEALEALEYYTETDAGLGESFLVVVPFCSVSGNIGAQRVLSGVNGLVFERSANDRFVDVSLTLSNSDNTFSSATEAKNTLKLRLVSHSVSIFD